MDIKRTFITDAQKKLFIDLIKNNEELLRGKFSSTFTHKMAQQRWEAIAEEVNAIPGAKKSWVQWKKVSLLTFIVS